ncbi:MAG TPA: response regulator transcription factor [Acidimicrobiia bacterium]|jgi:DNA-binding NarL/FixJ family response regulator|nr:response regulator transcription factor [Acidimicrobiia bacterium]
MISVVVVDDDQLVRSGVKMILETAPDIAVIGEASDGEEAIRLVSKSRPDVVLMDVRMPGTDGIEATRRLTTVAPECRIAILTTFEHDEYVFEALRAGASGFLLKRIPPDDLIAAVRTLAAGDALLSPSVTRRLIEVFARRATGRAQSAGFERLTDREREVLIELATGASNAELAEALFISEETVRTHVKRVLSKLGLRDRAQAIVLAYESGLVAPGSSAANLP